MPATYSSCGYLGFGRTKAECAPKHLYTCKNWEALFNRGTKYECPVPEYERPVPEYERPVPEYERPVPDLVVPDPVVPDPVVPDLVVPDLVVPDPVVPDLVVPDLVVPEPVVPEPVVPEPVVPDPVVPDPVVSYFKMRNLSQNTPRCEAATEPIGRVRCCNGVTGRSIETVTTVTHMEAAALCQATPGFDLCAYDTLTYRINDTPPGPRGTGFGYDSADVWSNTPCTP